MIAQLQQDPAADSDCKAAIKSGSLPRTISAIVEELIAERDIQNTFDSIEESNQELGKIFGIFQNFGQFQQQLQGKCDRVIEAKFKDKYEDSVKDEAKVLLRRSLIQAQYPNSNLEELLDSGFDMNVWFEAAASYTAAEALQAKLDLLELNQQIGHYRVGQRLISADKEHPIYIKTLVLTDKQISSTDWVRIEKCFERLTEKGLIEAALLFEEFQQECRKLAAAKERPKLYGLVEAWIGEVLEVVNKLYGAAIAEIFEVELKPRKIELNSLSLPQLLELEKIVDEAIPEDCELPSITTEINALEAKLRSPLHWPKALLGLFKKTLGKVTVQRPVINKRGTLTLEKWPSISRKIKPAEDKVKGEQLAIRLEAIKHWHLIEKRLNLDEGQLNELKTVVQDRACEKHDQFTEDDNAALDRPIGKVGKEYKPIPWVSDVLEVLPSLPINSEELPLIRYDLNVFVEEHDIQIVADKYKFDEKTIASFKHTINEIAISNKRPLDPITEMVRPWKDDLYQAIALEDLDATKLLKKEAPKYSFDDVEELVEEKTGVIKEELHITKEELNVTKEELHTTKQRLNEEQTYREQLQHQYNSLQQQVNQMQKEFEQKMERMMQQLIAQQQATSTNGNGNGSSQSVAAQPTN